MRAIDADDLYQKLKDEDGDSYADKAGKSIARYYVKHARTIEVCKNAKWQNLPTRGIGFVTCSECKASFNIYVNQNGEKNLKYCPNCGAKME